MYLGTSHLEKEKQKIKNIDSVLRKFAKKNIIFNGSSRYVANPSNTKEPLTITVTGIAKQTGCHKSNISRLFKTLVDLDMLCKVQKNKYTLSPNLLNRLPQQDTSNGIRLIDLYRAVRDILDAFYTENLLKREEIKYLMAVDGILQIYDNPDILFGTVEDNLKKKYKERYLQRTMDTVREFYEQKQRQEVLNDLNNNQVNNLGLLRLSFGIPSMLPLIVPQEEAFDDWLEMALNNF